METLGQIICGLGYCIMAIGAIWFLIVAFQESIVWLLVCIFIPFVSLLFLILHWDVAKAPFGLKILGIVVTVVGKIMIGPEPI